MNSDKVERQVFNPDEIPVVGSLGLLALGDVAFIAWRKVKVQHNIEKKEKLDEKE